MRTLTREQEAVTQFRQAAAPLRETATEFKGKGLVNFANQVIDAITFFGESELYARQAERCQVLKIQPQKAEFSSQQSDRLNQQGLKILSQSHRSLQQLSKDLESYVESSKDKLTDAQVKEFQTALSEVLVDAEVNASDLQAMDAEVHKFLDVVGAKGAAAVPEYLEKQAEILTDTRQQRSSQAPRAIPLPPWKIAALILIVGVGIMNFIHCGFFGCSASSVASYIGAYTVLALILLFC